MRLSPVGGTQRPTVRQDAGDFDQQHDVASVDHRRFVQKSLASRVVLQVDQAAPANQAISGHQRERGEDANLGSAVSTYVLIAIIKNELHLDASLVHLSTDFVGFCF